MNAKEKGSQIAKAGFKNEYDVVDRFNSWKKDKFSQAWLTEMNYNLDEIESVEAEVINGHYKADVQVRVAIKLKTLIDSQNLQVKLVSLFKKRGFNQIDKRRLEQYNKLWNIPEDVLRVLRFYTGEDKPYRKGTRKNNRMFMDEMTQDEQYLLIKWLKDKRFLIVSDIIKGRGKYAAEWYLVVQRDKEKISNWILKPINEVLNLYGCGEIVITKQGNIHIGKITMQRKGGDGGRESAKSLQFKVDPMELFNI